MMIARLRSNQTGIEGQKIKWEQVKEAYLDYKTELGNSRASAIPQAEQTAPMMRNS
jgi:hypothetical protein